MHSKGQHKQYIESTFNSDAPSIFKKANLNLYKAKEMEFLLVNCCVTSSYTGAVVILKNYGYSYMIYFVLLYRSERSAHEMLSLHTGSFLQMGYIRAPRQSICGTGTHPRYRAVRAFMGNP